MKYEEISPTMRAFLGGWEGLRRLGFAADDITFVVARSYELGGDLAAFVLLRTQSKEFKMFCGSVADADEAFQEYQRVATAVSQNEMTLGDLNRIWQESLCAQRPGEFLGALMRKGFQIPGKN